MTEPEYIRSWHRIARPIDAEPSELFKSFERGHGREGFIYFVTDMTGLVKIGKALYPRWRFTQMWTANPSLVPLLVIPTKDMAGVEGALRRRHRNKRIAGEWFALSELDILELADGIRDIAA